MTKNIANFSDKNRPLFSPIADLFHRAIYFSHRLLVSRPPKFSQHHHLSLEQNSLRLQNLHHEQIRMLRAQ